MSDEGWPTPGDGRRILFHSGDTRSFRVLWTLEALELKYELVLLAFPPRFCHPTYRELNPLGTVPTFFDGAVKMTESAAIVQFLADRYGKLGVRPEEPEYGTYLDALHFGEATLTFAQTLLLRYGAFEPEPRRVPQVVEDYGRWFLSRLEHAPQPEGDQPYIVGDRFTVADISIGYALKLSDHIGLLADASPSIQAYWQRLSARECFARTIAAQQKASADTGVPITQLPRIWDSGRPT